MTAAGNDLRMSIDNDNQLDHHHHRYENYLILMMKEPQERLEIFAFSSTLSSRSSLFPLTNLDVMTIFSQSGSQVSVSSRSEALGSFNSANLSQ